MKTEINDLIKKRKSSKAKMASAVSLYSRSSNGSDAEDVSQVDVTRLTHINETFQEKQLPLDVKDFEHRSDKRHYIDDSKNTS